MKRFSMQQTHTGLTAAAFLLVLGGTMVSTTPALANNYLINPATTKEWTNGEFWIDFDFNAGQVRRASNNLKVQGEALTFDTWVNYHCSDGDKLVVGIIEKAGPPPWSERRTTFNGNRSESHVTREMYYGVPFTTKAALRDACRAGAGSVSEEYAMKSGCKELIGGEMQRGLKRITAKLTCIDERPSTVVERVKLSCPPGYWVERTTKQEFTFEYDPARPPNLDNLCVPQGTLSGGKACPFIYTQDKPGGEWLAQGTILTYHNGKATERTQAQELKNFSGSVLIREIDPETSYIDSLSVVLFYPDGRKAVLAPVLEQLQAIDGDYLITNQGDEVEVVFEAPADWAFERAEITSHGYYEPY